MGARSRPAMLIVLLLFCCVLVLRFVSSPRASVATEFVPIRLPEQGALDRTAARSSGNPSTTKSLTSPIGLPSSGKRKCVSF